MTYFLNNHVFFTQDMEKRVTFDRTAESVLFCTLLNLKRGTRIRRSPLGRRVLDFPY